jgi:hypothetical protein
VPALHVDLEMMILTLMHVLLRRTSCCLPQLVRQSGILPVVTRKTITLVQFLPTSSTIPARLNLVLSLDQHQTISALHVDLEMMILTLMHVLLRRTSCCLPQLVRQSGILPVVTRKTETQARAKSLYPKTSLFQVPLSGLCCLRSELFLSTLHFLLFV